MKNFFNVIKYSINIIFESFVYLYNEIKYLIISILKYFIYSIFRNKKKNNDIKTVLFNKQLNDSKQGNENSALDSTKLPQPSTIKVDTLNQPQTATKTTKLPVSAKQKRVWALTTIFILISSYVAYTLWDLPDYSSLSTYKPPQITRVYSSDSKMIESYALEKRIFVPIYLIPTYIQDAFISAEDKNFYEHSGFDYWGLLRASFNNVKFLVGLSDNLEGASTITQQVAKNFLLSSQRTIRRKIREAILTKSIEEKYSKQKILELYLNEIYLGRSAYGISMASLVYFNKPITEVSIAEAAFLAALPKAPSSYDPAKYYNSAKIRRDWVLSKMYKNKKISFTEYQTAIETPIDYINVNHNKDYTLNYAKEEIRRDIIKKLGYDKLYNGGLIVQTSINAEYQKYAYESLRNGIIQYENKKGYRAPISYVKLTIPQGGYGKSHEWLDVFQQDSLVEKLKFKVSPWRMGIIINVKANALKVGLLTGEVITLKLTSLNNWAVPEDLKTKKNSILKDFATIFKNGDIILVEETKKHNYALRQIPTINGALLAMNPQNGEILAMQGGFSFLMSEFNRATQAMRQPGSAIKPFIYLTAMEQGYKPNDIILDAPIVIASKYSKSTWRPKNSLNIYRGFVTLRNSLEHSRNLATIRLADNLGLPAISNVLRRLKVYDTPLVNFSEVLGSKEVSVEAMVRAYAMIANGGKLITPSLIREIQNSNGESIFKLDNRVCTNCNNIDWQENMQPPILADERVSVIDPKNAFIVLNMLEGTVKRGTAIRGRIRGYNIAGKTGTTNDSKDAWFIGFSPDLVVGIYVGADIPVSLGKHTQGASLATPIFRSFMIKALQNKEALPFKTPAGIHMNWTDYKTGKPVLPTQSGNIVPEPIKEQQDIYPNIIGVRDNDESQNNLNPIPLNGDSEQNSLY